MLNNGLRRELCRLLGVRMVVVIGLVAGGSRAGPALGQEEVVAPGAKGRPNVLFVLTDDHGSVDVNCYGSKDLVTPAMDSLAAAGIRFTDFAAAAPICTPSRAAILTGRYPQRAGSGGNAGGMPGSHGMPGNQTTIAEVFKGAGYATGLVGKWHLGFVADETPNGQGFDSAFGFMGGCIDSYSHYYFWGGPNIHDLYRDGKEEWHDGEYFGDLMVSEGKKFIGANRDRPWLMYWAMNSPHYPLQGTVPWRERYKDLPRPRRDYAAALSTADERIGQLLEVLDELKLRENTIICFMSDHGHSTEDRTMGGGGNAGVYRGGKFSLFEGGVRVPAMIVWPGKIPAGEVRGQFATGCDWLPTLAELCGVTLSAEVKGNLDGRSLVPLLGSKEAASPHEHFVWSTDRNQWAVRSGKWKLVGNPQDSTQKGPVATMDGMYLSDLTEDPGERKNVAGEHPEVVAALRAKFEAWERETRESQLRQGYKAK